MRLKTSRQKEVPAPTDVRSAPSCNLKNLVLAVALLITFVASLQVYLEHERATQQAIQQSCTSSSSNSTKADPIHLVSVSCGWRYEQVLHLIGSIRHGSAQTPTVHYVFTEDNLVEDLTKKAAALQDIKHQVIVRSLPTPKEGADYSLFKKCASTRLFLPSIFSDTNLPLPERLVYMDSDVVVTAELATLWNYTQTKFAEHPETVFLLAQENLIGSMYQESPVTRTINGSPTQIHVLPEGTAGFNSGILVVDTSRWKARNVPAKIQQALDYQQKYNVELKFGDQGILNFVAAQDASLWQELPCQWNMRIDTYEECTPQFQQTGGILHGNREQFNSPVELPSSVFLALVLGPTTATVP